MWGLVNYGNPADFEWDVVSGVSAGSINALAMSGYPVGQEAEMAQWLSDEWKNLKTEDVWVDWPWGGKTKGLTLEPGLSRGGCWYQPLHPPGHHAGHRRVDVTNVKAARV